jgi:hypothetical protein
MFDSSGWGGWGEGKGKGQTKGKPFAYTNVPKAPPKATGFEPELSLLDELSTFTVQDFEEFLMEDPVAAQQAFIELILRNKALQAELAAAKTMLGL